MKNSHLLDNFLNSQISFRDKIYSKSELEETKLLLQNTILSIEANTECYLLEKDPLNFCILFFLLLEKNCIPIPLPLEISSSLLTLINEQNGRAFVSNGELQRNGVAQIKDENLNLHYICMTSGSTGKPKECILTVDGAIENAREHAKSLGITSKHTILQNLPLYHSFGIVAYLFVTSLHQCALEFSPIFLTPKNMSKRTWANCVLHCSPSQLNFMIKEKDISIKGVSVVSFGAGVVSSANILQLQSVFPEARFYVTYGLTELGPRVTTGEITKLMGPGYIGFPFSNIEARVYNHDTGLEVSGTGLLALNSPSLKYNIKESEIINDDSKKFFITQDQVKIEPTGEIYFRSRSDDLIKVGGISVYSIDIEEVARQFDGIEDLIVLPMPHSTYGDVPVIFVEGTIDLKQFETYLSSQLSNYQMPKKVFILEKLPRISINKIDRKKLKEEYFG